MAILIEDLPIKENKSKRKHSSHDKNHRVTLSLPNEKMSFHTWGLSSQWWRGSIK